jgi:arylsulfatase A-like enzyme
MLGQSVVVPRFPNSLLVVGSLAALLSVPLSACFAPRDAPDGGGRELRLVDPAQRAVMEIDLGGELGKGTVVASNESIATTEYPRSSINDDTRYVVAAPSMDWLLVQSGAVVPEGGVLNLLPEYPPAMPRAAAVLVVPKAKVDGKWRTFAPRVARTESKGRVRYVPVEIELGAETSGRKVDLHVDAYPLNWGDRQTYTTGRLEIGVENRLDFAFGILELARHCGPVHFTIEWCEADLCTEIFEETSDPSLPAQQGWQDRSISMAALAGLSGRLVFKSIRSGTNDEPFSFPVWANPTLVRPAKAARGPHNVILLSIDTQRADHLTSYGYQHDTAPFIDRGLAKKGAVFENMVAGATSTSPAHMTMFTGMQASAHGLTQGLEGLAPWIYTVTEAVRSEGYETGAVTEDGWLGIHHGFGRGFNIYVENRSANIMAPTGQVDVTFARAREWLQRHKDRRFFLFLHTFQVHDPFSPPPQYQSLFRQHDGQPIDDNSPWYLKWMNAYDQEIRYTDDEVRTLWREIERLGLAENTIFIVTSDHGESFMEHGYFGHGAHPHEAVVRVPLIVRGPGVANGVRVAEPVGHVDLAPTILDLMGIDASLEQFQGRSLAPELRASNREAEAVGTYFTESWSKITRNAPKHFVGFMAPAFAARRGSLKLIRYKTADGVAYEAYDLARDPDERSNLWPTERDRFVELERLLANYEDGMHAFRARLRGSNEGSGGIDPEAVELDPEQEAKLKALGYLN